ncbi:TraK domain-containing protein [Desulfonema limicola]|nr:type-F conjugative transfer system secretin TraK [Desulfonema limicola]
MKLTGKIMMIGVFSLMLASFAGAETRNDVKSVTSDIQKLIDESENRLGGNVKEHRSAKPEVTVPEKTASDQENDTIYVYPEKKKYIGLSKVDINRFHCEQGNVTGVIFSEDKGLTVNRSGSNAFLRILPDSYAFESPFELYMICAEDTLYRIIGDPQWVSARNVILKDGDKKIEQALDFFKGKTREENIVRLIKKSWNEDWDPAWTITPKFKPVMKNENYRVSWYRSIDTGSEWVIEQYIVEGMKGNVRIEESAFVNRQTVAVSCFDPVITNGKLAQVVVVRGKIQ